MTVNARAILLNKKALGADPLVDKILSEPESAEAKLFVKTKSIFNNHLKKQYVEASFLASQDLAEISALLEMPLDVVTMYRDIYYNVEGLDKLSKLELLNVSDKAESLLKLWALSQGLDFIRWRLGGKVSVNPIEGLQDLFTTCVYKSKEAMFNGNTSEASKESTKYIKLSMDLARLLKMWVMDSAAAKRDIEIALQEIVPNFGGLDTLDAEIEEMERDAADADTDAGPLSVEVFPRSLDEIQRENDGE